MKTAKEWGLAKLTSLLSHCQYPLHLFCVAPCLHFCRVNLHQCPLSCETWSLQNGAFNIAVENQTYDIPALSIIEAVRNFLFRRILLDEVSILVGKNKNTI